MTQSPAHAIVRQSLALVLLLAALVLPQSVSAKKKPPAPKPAPAPSPTQADATYLGSAACSGCHLEIARTFVKASMGHSLVPVTPALIRTLSLPGTYYDTTLNRHYEIRADNDVLYQTEFAFDDHGKELFRSTHPVQWIVGTGENGFGALIVRDGYLVQGPLSYYSRAAQWNLSPGYEHGDLGFNRLIQPGCIYCHSGRPRPTAGYNGKYDEPAFTQTSVGCENCHGPGSAHVAAMSSGDDFHDKSGQLHDPTIVNPARLTRQRSDDICMSCHQVGDARVLQPGKTYQDFRPGQPLARILAVFQIPPTHEHPPDDDHLEHYYSMTLSKCYRASLNAAPDKQMRCITCHDPHVEPTGAEVPAWFNQKCLTCHTQQSCTAPAATRQATAPADNCIGCHMPKRDIRVISHSTATNHRILRAPGEAFPEAAFNQTTADLPDLLMLDEDTSPGTASTSGSAAGRETPLPLVRLQAYNILKLAHPEFKQAWLTTLTTLETSEPENAIVQASVGHRELEAHNYPAAIDHLTHALRLNPLDAAAWLDLAEAQDQSGLAEEAIASARKAVALDPLSTDAQKALVGKLIAGKHYDEAITAMQSYMKNFPEDDFMRRMLAIAQAP